MRWWRLAFEVVDVMVYLLVLCVLILSGISQGALLIVVLLGGLCYWKGRYDEGGA